MHTNLYMYIYMWNIYHMMYIYIMIYITYIHMIYIYIIWYISYIYIHMIYVFSNMMYDLYMCFIGFLRMKDIDPRPLTFSGRPQPVAPQMAAANRPAPPRQSYAQPGKPSGCQWFFPWVFLQKMVDIYIYILLQVLYNVCIYIYMMYTIMYYI